MANTIFPVNGKRSRLVLIKISYHFDVIDAWNASDVKIDVDHGGCIYILGEKEEKTNSINILFDLLNKHLGKHIVDFDQLLRWSKYFFTIQTIFTIFASYFFFSEENWSERLKVFSIIGSNSR